MSWCDGLSASNALEAIINMIDNCNTVQVNADNDDAVGDNVWQLQRETQLEHQPDLQGARIPGS